MPGTGLVGRPSKEQVSDGVQFRVGIKRGNGMAELPNGGIADQEIKGGIKG